MFKFIRKEENNKKTHITEYDSWVDILFEFLLFLKGCGFLITRKNLEDYLDYFEDMGALCELDDRTDEVLELSKNTGLDPTFVNNVLLEKDLYEKNYYDFKEVELEVEQDTLDLIQEKARALNVSDEVLISALLKSYLNNEKS